MQGSEDAAALQAYLGFLADGSADAMLGSVAGALAEPDLEAALAGAMSSGSGGKGRKRQKQLVDGDSDGGDSEEEGEGSGRGGRKRSDAARNKASREKARREKINDRFIELAQLVEPGKEPKTDKLTVLCEAIRTVRQLQVENHQLKQLNKFLEEKTGSLERDRAQAMFFQMQQSGMMQQPGASGSMMGAPPAPGAPMGAPMPLMQQPGGSMMGMGAGPSMQGPPMQGPPMQAGPSMQAGTPMQAAAMCSMPQPGMPGGQQQQGQQAGYMPDGMHRTPSGMLAPPPPQQQSDMQQRPQQQHMGMSSSTPMAAPLPQPMPQQMQQQPMQQHPMQQQPMQQQMQQQHMQQQPMGMHAAPSGQLDASQQQQQQQPMQQLGGMQQQQPQQHMQQQPAMAVGDYVQPGDVKMGPPAGSAMGGMPGGAPMYGWQSMVPHAMLDATQDSLLRPPAA